MRLASHTHGSVIPWNTLNFMLIISTLDFPVMIEIKSTGPATREHPYSVGDYKLLNNKTAQLRKVYKKTDSYDYIFYNSKFLL